MVSVANAGSCLGRSPHLIWQETRVKITGNILFEDLVSVLLSEDEMRKLSLHDLALEARRRGMKLDITVHVEAILNPAERPESEIPRYSDQTAQRDEES
jgi:hypothetical protein